jgi:hypothetical protein
VLERRGYIDQAGETRQKGDQVFGWHAGLFRILPWVLQYHLFSEPCSYDDFYEAVTQNLLIVAEPQREDYLQLESDFESDILPDAVFACFNHFIAPYLSKGSRYVRRRNQPAYLGRKGTIIGQGRKH